MLLALDVGNTNIVVGCMEGKTPLRAFRLATRRDSTGGDYAAAISQLLELAGISRQDVEQVIISSVVPQVTRALQGTALLLTGKEPLVLGQNVRCDLPILIDQPETLGADLLAAAVGALDQFRPPLLLIDMGTATTVTVVDENGAFRVAYRDDASHLENGLQTLKRQAWLKNARGFEGGIYYVPSGAEGHFDVCRAGETVGAVSVDKCENGLATIGEFWLENDVQGLGFGQQLVGQALSYARAHGCERLSTGRIAKSNALGLRRAREWGFTQTGEGADWLEFQKNFEYDEESCWKKLQEVIEKEK